MGKDEVGTVRTNRGQQLSAERRAGHETVLDSEPKQFHITLESQIFHHPILVEGDGPGGDVQHGRHLFHRVSLGHELQDFTLAARQIPVRYRTLPRLDERSFHALRNERSDIGLSL